MALSILLGLLPLAAAAAAPPPLNARGAHATASLDGTLRGGGACSDIVDCQANGACAPSQDVTCGVVDESFPSRPVL